MDYHRVVEGIQNSTKILKNVITKSLPFKIAEAHSWTWVSGIFDESCIAGVTIFIDSRELPKDKKM